MNESEATPSRQLNIDRIHDLLDTRIFGTGNRIVYLPVVDSTNSLAMKLARSGSEEGVVVLTDNQTAGKGRQGRHWVDFAGCNVLSSTLLQPLFPPYLLVMIASLAVVDAIAASSSVAAAIKWPNDVLIGERKIAGILIETSHDQTGRFFAVVGIGVNVNGHSSRFVEDTATAALLTNSGLIARSAQATTLEEECGHEVSREAFIAHLLYQMESRYLALQQEALDSTGDGYGPIARLIREHWRDRLATLGRTIQVRQGSTLLSGVAEDVNDQGELLLRSHSGECISITWGDVG